jgi:hypothetical protein
MTWSGLDRISIVSNAWDIGISSGKEVLNREYKGGLLPKRLAAEQWRRYLWTSLRG